MLGNKGLALIVAIIIILITAIAVLGIAVFISTTLSLNIVRASTGQAISAAQSGIYAAINDYLTDAALPYWDKIPNTQLFGNVRFRAGRDANFLLVSATASQRGGAGNRTLSRVSIGNINDSDAITVNAVRVEWDFGGSLSQIQLGGVAYAASGSSPATVTLTPPFTLTARQFFSKNNDNTWLFTSSIDPGSVIACTFTCNSDGSSRKAILFGTGKHNEFSITATGEVQGATNWRRTIEATYDAGSNLITSWQEVQNHIP